MDFDVIIIGAGIIGCSIARELSRYDLQVAVVERASYVCSGQTKANGAIIHGGHDPKPGSLKATLNVEGNALFPGMCRDLGVEFLNTGIFVIAFDDSEVGALHELLARGRENGVPGLELLDGAEVRCREPRINPAAAGALSITTGGVADVFRLVIGLAEHAVLNGVRFFFETEVTDLVIEGGKVRGIVTGTGKLSAPCVVNCAGVDSDLIMKMAGEDWFEISPRFGEYYIIDKNAGEIVTRPCFQVPTKHGKGMVIFPTTHGNTIIGGESIEVDDRGRTCTSADGFERVVTKVQRLVPGLDSSAIIASFTGLRASGNQYDFHIDWSRKADGLLNLAGVASPGLSAAPAIANMAVGMVGERTTLRPGKDRKQTHTLQPLFRDLPEDRQHEWLRRDSRYGRIVCRCENITEGDIVAAIHAPLPARTIDAIKIRTKTGMGRCQGAFDLSRVLHILSRETGMEPVDIRKNETGSGIVAGYTKEACHREGQVSS
jgi:glycerol-3-phosphate dehydrogenase